MVIVRLSGGLGNQLFQYALGRSIEERLGFDVKFDVSIPFGFETKREFELDKLNTKVKFATQSEITSVKSRNTYQKIFSKLLKKRLGNEILQDGRLYNPIFETLKDNKYIDGNWQSELYFNQIRSTLLEELKVITPIDSENAKTLDRIHNSNAICLHVRRGDYAKIEKFNKHHGLTPIEYYNRSILKMSELINNPSFFIFSDDINWTKENIKIEGNATFMTHNPPERGWEDLRLMYSCKHFIIANSTFSWWGAWISSNPSKVVIAPNQWFANQADNNSHDIIPKEWIKI